MMSFHPAGFPHGPHPKAMDKVKTKTHTDEKAVMIDSRWPLKRDESLSRFEVDTYWQSWMK
jgi:homogentisate 1,2-dioxygenase